MRNKWSLLLFTGLMVSAVGCAKYYKIQDPGGNREFYTNGIEETGSGTIRFNDLKTGSRVTLQNSMVKEVKPEEVPADLRK